MSTAAVPFTTTLHVRDHCLCLHAQRAARALSRRFDEAFRPLGLTSGQFSLLMSLNRPEPPTIGMVAEVLAMDRSTVTVDAKDRRGRRAALTGTGQALLARATPIWVEEHAAVEAELDGEADALRKGLRGVG